MSRGRLCGIIVRSGVRHHSDSPAYPAIVPSPFVGHPESMVINGRFESSLTGNDHAGCSTQDKIAQVRGAFLSHTGNTCDNS